MINKMTPKSIVDELDRFIVGQNDAKRAVAIALRNRWRRLNISSDIRNEILPKNILMIGATGVGKTEIARRVAKLADAPFVKVEATKFTEIGYVGRDVEQIIRDLVDISVHKEKDDALNKLKEKVNDIVEDRILKALVGDDASEETVQKFRDMLKKGDLEEKEIEIFVDDSKSNSIPTMDIPGMPGSQIGMMNLGDLINKAFPFGKQKKKKMLVKNARKTVEQEESEKLIDNDKIVRDAIKKVEESGIVFIDEIDKVCSNKLSHSNDVVSREGVQRDLLPLIEGTSVSTKYGTVKTDFILFITSGAFHTAKPSDLLPELQGRLPIRVELKSLSKDDLVRILTEPESSLVKQYIELLKTEDVELVFEDDAIAEIAEVSEKINETVENIGARRLHTVMEKLLEDVSFDADKYHGKKFIINSSYVNTKVGNLVQNIDLSKFIL